MAYTCREVAARGSDAFAALIDPHTYPRWLIGATAIRGIDDTWPQPGSRFHHVVGVGPLQLRDSTEVLAIDVGTLLQLEVRVRPLIAAVATFRVIESGDRCVIALQEEPAKRLIGNLFRPVLDPATHWRNHRSLRRLAELIEQRALEATGSQSG